MLNRSLFIAALIATCLCVGSTRVLAQAGGSCPELVDTALTNASFSIETDVLQELKSFPTDPLAAYRVAALNLPTSDNNTLNVLVMGQSTLETNGAPAAVTETIQPVEATAASNANLRSSPNGALAGSVQSGETLELVGKNAAGDWYQVLLASQESAWIFGQLVTVDTAALADLPVSDGDDTAENASLPPLSLMFRAATDEAACADAAAGLTVQSPADTDATFNLNGTTMELRGTAVIQTQPLEIAGDVDNNTVTIATLLDGQLTVRLDNLPVRLTEAGDTLGITLANVMQEIDTASSAMIATNVQQLCLNTMKTGLLTITAGACDTILVREFNPDDYELPPYSDIEGDVVVCGTNQAASADDAPGADIVGATVRLAESSSPIPDGYLIDVLMDIPPADTLNTAYSFAIVVWEHDAKGNRSKGKLYQIHEGVPTMGQINLNFAPVSGTENHVSASATTATFNVGVETKQVDIESFLKLKPNSQRVCDTFHSDIDEAFLTG